MDPRPSTADEATQAAHRILAAAPDPFLVLHPEEYRIVAASDRYLELTGRGRDELVGQSIFQAFPADPGDPTSQEGVEALARVVRDTFPRSIDFRVHIPRDLPPVAADPTQLHQVLLNLLVNARDAMPRGGRLMVEARVVEVDAEMADRTPGASPGPHMAIRVTDTGTGIPPRVLEQIFDPFFTTKEVGEGTGLGLSTVAAIMRGHGGFVTVRSEEGQGTTFQLHFPLEVARPTQPPAHRPTLSRSVEAAPRRGAGQTILVVDDERSVRDITRQTLEAFGYRVLTASDGAEGVAVYSRSRGQVELVLTDLMMPIMDGPAMVQALLRMDPEVRVVAASGLGTQDDVALLLEAGVRTFLPKPYTAETLLRVVGEALAHAPS